MLQPLDLAQIRFDNALALFDNVLRNTVEHPDAATLRGAGKAGIAEQVQIQPSYWSQIKGRSRRIGERLARRFEQLCHKPHGWMNRCTAPPARQQSPAPWRSPAGDHHAQDNDERFILGLVLTYYRRHPQKARTRLLDLLGEVLTPAASDTKPAAQTAQKPPAPGKAPPRYHACTQRRPRPVAAFPRLVLHHCDKKSSFLFF